MLPFGFSLFVIFIAACLGFIVCWRGGSVLFANAIYFIKDLIRVIPGGVVQLDHP